MGEAISGNALTIRTRRFIGRSSAGRELVEWFLAQQVEKRCVAFVRRDFYRLHNLQLAAVIGDFLIQKFQHLSGLWQVAADPIITKFDIAQGDSRVSVSHYN